MKCRTILKALAAICTLSLGCQENPKIVRLDYSLNADEQNAVIKAFDAWCRATCEDYCGYTFSVYRVSWPLPDNTIGVTIRTLPPDRQGECRRHTSLGGRSSEISLAPNLKGETLVSTVMHEVGHALGAEHTAFGVMSESGSAVQLSEADISQLGCVSP